MKKVLLTADEKKIYCNRPHKTGLFVINKYFWSSYARQTLKLALSQVILEIYLLFFFLTNTGSDTCTIKVIIFWKKNPGYSDQINQWCREYKAGLGKWQGPAVWGQNLECQNYIYHRAKFLLFFLSWIVWYISVSYTSTSSWFLLWLFLL